MGSGADTLSPDRALLLSRTLRRGFRAWWDRLGLSCALSAGWVICFIVPMVAVVQLTARSPLAMGLFAPILGLVLFGFATAAVHRAVWQAAEGVEVTLRDLLPPDRVWALDASLLALLQTLGSAAVGANLAFYASVRSPLGIALAVAFAYGAALWLLACCYQWPLLIAGERGIIKREDARKPSLTSVIRNSLVLILIAPGHSMGLGAVAAATLLPLIASGAGLVLVAPALSAFMFTHCVRDHMIRLEMLPPPDEGEPVADNWTVPRQ